MDLILVVIFWINPWSHCSLQILRLLRLLKTVSLCRKFEELKEAIDVLKKSIVIMLTIISVLVACILFFAMVTNVLVVGSYC